MHCESLEARTMMYADSLFKHSTVHLLGGHLYELAHPIILKNHQKIVGTSSTNPPIIRYRKNNLGGILVMPEGSYDIRIRNVKFEGRGDTPAIRVSGNSHYIGNVAISSNTGSAVLMSNARNVLVENCTQKIYTQKGFIYGVKIKNITIRNITTFGNLYENDMRFHEFDGLYLTNIKIDGANPKANVHWSNAAGLKDNALRIHDGKNAFINGLTATGNVTFGVMDQDNGGYSDLKRGNMKVYYKKMYSTSDVTAKNMKIYGNLILATNLHFKISKTVIVSWKRGQCITFNPTYGPFKKDSRHLFRRQAVGTFAEVRTFYTSSNPKNRNIDGVAKFFAKRVPFSSASFAGEWIPNGVAMSKTFFNDKHVSR